MSATKEAVAEFWNSEACGERYGADQDLIRYRFEPEILEFADFQSSSGRSVLEIGVGMGSDFVRWARTADMAVGVDLTHRAASLTARRVQEERLPRRIAIADAELLPFSDASFDIVYSWGVLHHTPDTARAISEVVRILKPGGVLRVMLYNRRSWVAIAAWVRYALLVGRPWRSLTRAIAETESPGTQAFTRSEVRLLFRGSEVEVRPHLTHWDRKWFPGLARIFGDRFGWFLLIRGRKPE